MFNRKFRMHQFMGQKGRAGNRMIKFVCPNCGYSVVHERGVPCRSLQCPKCHVSLTPSDLISNVVSEILLDNKNDEKGKSINPYPLVDTEICEGCGQCVDLCPQNAIQLKDGIAVIDEDKCKNCRKCVRVCPVLAIK